MVAQRNRQRASGLLAALEDHLDPQKRAEREATRDQSRLQRLEAFANIIAARDDRAELRELRKQVDDLTRELTAARMDNMRLQNELRMMQMMMNMGFAPVAGVSLTGGYVDDVGQAYGVPM